jgi:lysophospholipase L1-like esterase
MRGTGWGWVVLLAPVVALAATAPAAASEPAPLDRWVGSWASAQQIPEDDKLLTPQSLAGATLRQIVHLSAGGPRIRIRVSNAFGATPLHLTEVHVAKPVGSGTGRIDSGTDRALTFNDRPDVLIPAGSQYMSDPVDYPVAPLSDLAITMRIEAAPQPQTGHPGSRTTSYLIMGTPPASAELKGAQIFDHWYFLSGVDVASPPRAAALVVLGDSITDGRCSTTNGNDRWPDKLAARLQGSAATSGVSVLNAGIGGNRLLNDGLGPNALARFDRDVLAQTGVRYLLVLEGVNDLGTLPRPPAVTDAQHEDLVRRMIGAYREIVSRARNHGIKVVGGTILPWMGATAYKPERANEADRQLVNAWIRAPGNFDAVVDFDRVTSDPAHPGQLRPEFDCGDHLHPAPEGYRAMATAIPLDLLK